jgi:hypothetical protein
MSKGQCLENELRKFKNEEKQMHILQYSVVLSDK